MKKPETSNQKPEHREDKQNKKIVFLKIFIFTTLVSVLWFLVTVVAGCAKKQETAKQDEVIPVRVMEVKLQDMRETLDYIGNIKAQDEAVVYPKVSGKIIEKVKEEGSHVDKGDVFAYIDRDEVGFTFEKAPIESPLSGIIGRVYIDKGTSVTPQTPVALIVDMDKVKIDLDVPEKYIPRVSLEQEARISVDAYPEEEFSGQVTKISPVVDLTTRSAPIEITVDNPEHRLKSGMFAKVKLTLSEHKNAPVVLKEAIMGKDPELYVYVVEDNKAILKKVSLGIRQGPYYQVQEGLREGDLVVIMGQQRLREGAQVEMEE